MAPIFGRKLLATAFLLILSVSAGCNHRYCERSSLPSLPTKNLVSKRGTAAAAAAAVAVERRQTQNLYVPNGDFECGITPWVVQVPDSAVSYTVSTPGFSSSTSHSFQAHFVPPSTNTEYGVSIRIISAPVGVTPNVPYKLTFWTYFDNQYAGFIGVQFNDVAYYTIDATDHGWGGTSFTLNTVDYTPTTSTVTLKFEFLFGGPNGVNSLDRIDGITFAPA